MTYTVLPGTTTTRGSRWNTTTGGGGGGLPIVTFHPTVVPANAPAGAATIAANRNPNTRLRCMRESFLMGGHAPARPGSDRAWFGDRPGGRNRAADMPAQATCQGLVAR